MQVPAAPWLRLSFSEAELGSRSYLTVTSLQDGARQRLDAEGLARWQHSSAFFNGDAVQIELYVAPGDANVFMRMDEVVVGDHGIPESQCGPADNRVSSNDPAVGRLLNVGCTAWIITDGKLVSAGHCLSSASLAGVVQFNVPPSLSNGTLQHPGPEDQYTVNTGSRVWTDGGTGNDWGVFSVFDNSETGLQPIEAQSASFNVVQDLGPSTIRITGFGVDDGNDNQTQQTHTGPNAGSTGTTMRYQTDTEGGNSGSPVIDEATGNAVGVHTHGGCSTSGGGNNSGTSAFNSAFWAALDLGGGGNTPPNAAFSFSCAGLACDFTDESTDPDGAIATRDWDFDDGGTSSATDPSHTFPADGTYAVALTVTDDDGATDTAVQNVAVSAGGGSGITLTATSRFDGRKWFADLAWSPDDGGRVDVYQDGAVEKSTRDDGAFSLNLGRRASGSYDLQVCEQEAGGDCSNIATITISEADAVAADAHLAGEEGPATGVLGAYPNPFSARATIAFALAEQQPVELAVYNSLGQRVAVLAGGVMEAGSHQAVFDASALPSGVYLYRLRAGGTVETGRLLLVR